jgi:hypothetical protein
LVDLRLRRIGELRGPLVRELSDGTRDLLNRQIANRRPSLVEQINGQIKKNGDQFRLSLHDLLRSKWGALASERLGVSAEDAGSPGPETSRPGD